jgi:ABC-type amino acid transport system permease subunit
MPLVTTAGWGPARVADPDNVAGGSVVVPEMTDLTGVSVTVVSYLATGVHAGIGGHHPGQAAHVGAAS